MANKKTEDQLKAELREQIAEQRKLQRTTLRDPKVIDLDVEWEANGGHARDIAPSYGIQLVLSNGYARQTLEVNELEAEELFRQLEFVLTQRREAREDAR